MKNGRDVLHMNIAAGIKICHMADITIQSHHFINEGAHLVWDHLRGISESALNLPLSRKSHSFDSPQPSPIRSFQYLRNHYVRQCNLLD